MRHIILGPAQICTNQNETIQISHDMDLLVNDVPQIPERVKRLQVCKASTNSESRHTKGKATSDHT